VTAKGQGRLWPEPETGGLAPEAPPLNCRARLKEAVRRSLEGNRLSRELIAERMNELARQEGVRLRRPVTLAVVDAWAALSKTALPELGEVPLFCAATGRDYLLEALGGCRGRRLIGPGEARLLAWAEKEWAIRRLTKDKRALEPQIERAA